MARVATPERAISLGADEGYNAGEFIEILRDICVTHHLAQSKAGGASAVPDEVATSEGYAVSQQRRKRIEQGFGWVKCIGPSRRMMVRCLNSVGQDFMTTMVAYNLVRMRTLMQVLRRPPNAGKRHFSRVEQPLGDALRDPEPPNQPTPACCTGEDRFRVGSFRTPNSPAGRPRPSDRSPHRCGLLR
jgi:hypothetical protein